MSDDLKQEFDAARIKHMLFKSKLRSALFGSQTAEGPIRDPQQCAFGHWLTRRVLTDFGHLPESRELDRLHTQIHKEASRLLDMHHAGQQDEAIGELAEINRLADQITRLLRTIEESIRGGQ